LRIIIATLIGFDKSSRSSRSNHVIDRARNVFLYAWFCYELLVVSELQAFGALELALKLRLLESSQKISSLGSLLRLARETGCCRPR